MKDYLLNKKAPVDRKTGAFTRYRYLAKVTLNALCRYIDLYILYANCYKKKRRKDFDARPISFLLILLV